MRKKLMIVEKDRDILHVLTHIFEEAGYEVSAFESETGVLEKIVKEKPGAIVLDIIQPTPEGTILCREIRDTPEIKDIPIIALSTHVQYHKIKDMCADKVLGKPFDISEVIDAVESQLAV
jgi:two-component system phosphate regulon response regulator PhoB